MLVVGVERLTGAPVTIGRDPGPGGLMLGDTEVSRAHAVVEPVAADAAGPPAWPRPTA